jgi:hypothetical protein
MPCPAWQDHPVPLGIEQGARKFITLFLWERAGGEVPSAAKTLRLFSPSQRERAEPASSDSLTAHFRSRCLFRWLGCSSRRLGSPLRRLGCSFRRRGCSSRRLGCSSRPLGCLLRRLGCSLQEPTSSLQKPDSSFHTPEGLCSKVHRRLEAGGYEYLRRALLRELSCNFVDRPLVSASNDPRNHTKSHEKPRGRVCTRLQSIGAGIQPKLVTRPHPSNQHR